MQPVPNDAVTLATFNLGGGEITLILALVLILFGAKKLPEMARGLGRGISLFGKAIDDQSEEAGRSAGGIYGKPAAQAITPDNQVAELYDPAVLRDERKPSTPANGIVKVWRKLREWISRIVRAIPGLHAG